MPHARVDAFVDRGVEPLKHLRRFPNTDKRDVRIHVAAAEEHRRACQRAVVLARRAWRTDQSAAEADNTRIATRVSRREFQRETGALREPEKNHAFVTDTSSRDGVQ